jgi:IclR family transcriptional regulator, acetate operon repressor
MAVVSVARALDVMEYLSGTTESVPAAVIRRRCRIPKSTLHHLLHQLQEKRYVVYRSREHGWALGPRLSEISSDNSLFAHALAVLEAFPSGAIGLTPQAIAHTAGLSPSSVERILAELVDRGFVGLRADGSYALGLELVSLASRIRWLDTYRLVARPNLVHLRDVLGETANLVVQDGEHALYVDQVESHSPLRYSGWIGRRVPIAGTAAGAALADPSTTQIVADAVEVGVTAVAAGVEGADPPLAITVLAPSARLEMAGVARAAHWVEAASRDVANRLTAQKAS